MKLFNKTQQKQDFYDLPKKKQQELLLKAAQKANKQQKQLENRYLKLQAQAK
jgi:hypothetical protein